MSEEIRFEHANKGDRVRVTRVTEGTVLNREDGLLGLVMEDGSVITMTPHSQTELTIERIEPEYVPDALYQDANGVVWVYTPDFLAKPWLRANTVHRGGYGELAYPLVRLELTGEQH